MEQEEEPKHPGGRPKIDIPLDEVEKLAAIGATYQELADFFECALSTIEARMREDEEFSRCYKRGASHRKLSLRRECYKQAFERSDGSTSMRIWLTKQDLGMMEPTQRVENKIEGSLKLEAARPTSEQLQFSLVKKFEAAGWKMIPPPEEKKDNDGSGS